LSALRPSLFTPGKQPPVPIAQGAGWPPKAVWTFWVGDKSLNPNSIRIPDWPDRSLT
jgi:hypothetical protein